MNYTSSPPAGCPPSIDPRYFNLCDLRTLWGVVVEAVAAAGIFTSAVLLIVTVSSLRFIEDRIRKNMLALQISFIIFSLGLFGLSFAFIVGQDIITCIVRRFGFGVLFAGCFACLLMHALWLALLDRNKSPNAWLLWLGALGLWLVEVIINTEWVIIVQMLGNNTEVHQLEECTVTKTDFTLALIYVMALLFAVVLMAVPSMYHKQKLFRQDAIFILLTGILSVCVWLTWIVMYVHGNKAINQPTWDDATLAIALVSNGWVFLMMYTIPETCALNQKTENEEESLEDPQGTSRSRSYENILSVQKMRQHGTGLENKAFSIYDLDKGNKLESPYSDYSGQVHRSVYQPTELTLICSRTITTSHEAVQPRAAPPPPLPGTFSPLRMKEG